MNQGNGKKNGLQKDFFKEMLRFALLGIALLLLTVFVPLLGVLLFCMPIWMSFLLASWPKGYALGTIGCWLAFSLLILQSPSLFYVLFLFFLLAVSFSVLHAKSGSAAWTIAAGSAVIIAGILVGLYLLTGGKGDKMEPIMRVYEQTIPKDPGLFQDLTDRTGLTLASILKQIQMILPGVLMNSAILCSLVNYYMTLHLLRRRRVGLGSASFSEFALPGNVYGGILLLYAWFRMMKWIKLPFADLVGLNGMWVFILLFYLQGMAVLLFWAKRRRSLLLGGTLMGAALLFAPVSMAVGVMGFFDGAMNFRRLPR